MSGCTVETLYSTIYYSKYFIELNIYKFIICCPLNSQKTPHTSPFRASYGVSFMSTSTEIDRVIKGFYCTNQVTYVYIISRPVICKSHTGATWLKLSVWTLNIPNTDDLVLSCFLNGTFCKVTAVALSLIDNPNWQTEDIETIGQEV